MDPRFDLIEPLVTEGRIKTFGNVFRWVPRSAIADELAMGPSRLTHLILNPLEIDIGLIYNLADLFSLDRDVMWGLLRRHVAEVKKGGYVIPKLNK